jgi:hypothetical protein
MTSPSVAAPQGSDGAAVDEGWVWRHMSRASPLDSGSLKKHVIGR